MKTCTLCKEEKENTSFHKKQSSRDGLHSWCKTCVATKNKEWVTANKERHANTCATWYKDNKQRANTRSTEWHYQTRYNISYEYFKELASKQQNLCPICGVELTFGKIKTNNRAVLDHCHTTNKIRGVLCNRCNTALGKFNDNIITLKQAIMYLQENQN